MYKPNQTIPLIRVYEHKFLLLDIVYYAKIETLRRVSLGHIQPTPVPIDRVHAILIRNAANAAFAG